MPSLDDAARVALGLPEVTEGERYRGRCWAVGKKVFAWERPFSKADVKRFGTETRPGGPILAVSVDGLVDKEAVLAAGHRGVFTIEHFNGYPAVLIQLNVVGKRVLRELIIDAWLTCAPATLADTYLQQKKAPRPSQRER